MTEHIEFRRVDTHDGPEIEPSLKMSWDEYTQMRWYAATTELATGLNIEIHEARDDKGERFLDIYYVVILDDNREHTLCGNRVMGPSGVIDYLDGIKDGVALNTTPNSDLTRPAEFTNPPNTAGNIAIHNHIEIKQIDIRMTIVEPDDIHTYVTETTGHTLYHLPELSHLFGSHKQLNNMYGTRNNSHMLFLAREDTDFSLGYLHRVWITTLTITELLNMDIVTSHLDPIKNEPLYHEVDQILEKSYAASDADFKILQNRFRESPPNPYTDQA